jgi:hypothetical protein
MQYNMLKGHGNKVFLGLYKAKLLEFRDILVSGFDGWLRAAKS